MATLRVQLKPAQMAAALHLAGARPTSRSPLAALPAVGSDAAARKSLQGTGVLDAGRDGMSATHKSAFMALADPRVVIVIMANRAAHPEWAETMLLTHGPGQSFVAYAGDNQIADVAVLPSPAHALVLIDELAGLTLLPASSGSAPVDLDVAGFGAAVAAADVVQQARLEGQLDRTRNGAEITLSVDALEAALERGMAATDPRWVVDAARAVSPPVFSAAAGRMEEGLAGLKSAGFVASGRTGHTLTPVGAAFAASLGRLMGSSGFTIAAAGPDGEVGAAHLGILRAVDAIWIAAWREVSTTDGRVSLHQASTTTAMRLMNALVDPLSSPETEGAPAAPTRTSAAKKAAKAASAKKSAPARAPARATTTAVWSPTHAVPAGGMAAWAVPDGNQPSIANLDAALPVEVTEQRGAWAHIVCSNGWEAWVDGRELTPA